MKAGAPRGFTLVELVTALVIMAVLAAVVTARLAPTATDTAWFQEEVRAAVRYAQRQAVAQRRQIHVVVNASPNQLSLCYDSGCATKLNSLRSGTPFVLAAPAGVLLSSAPATFFFNGLGQPSAAAALNVNGKPVTVAAETGYVQ